MLIEFFLLIINYNEDLIIIYKFYQNELIYIGKNQWIIIE